MVSASLMALIFGVLFAVSELLDAIPQVKASSIWKAIRNIIYVLGGKTPPSV